MQTASTSLNIGADTDAINRGKSPFCFKLINNTTVRFVLANWPHVCSAGLKVIGAKREEPPVTKILKRVLTPAVSPSVSEVDTYGEGTFFSMRV